MDQTRGLGDRPDIDGVVADRFVGAQRDRDVVIQHRAPGQHAAAEPQVADRVVYDRRTGVGDHVEVGLVYPHGVDHVGVLFEKSGGGGVADQRPPGEPRLLGHQGALDLGLQHVRVQRQAVTLGQIVQRGEVLQADALRRGDRDGRPDPVVRSAVPGSDQMVVRLQQLGGGSRCRLVKGSGFVEFGYEWQLFGLGQLRLVQREERSDPAVAVGRRHRVDDLRIGERHQEGVVLHAGDAPLQHLDRAEHGPQVGLPRARPAGPGRRVTRTA